MIEIVNGNSELSSKIKSLLLRHYNTPKNEFKYYFGYYQTSVEIPEDDWNEQFLAIIDPFETAFCKILGLVRLSFARYPNYVSGVSIINFSYDENRRPIENNGFIFIKDILLIIDEIFTKYNFTKICFCVGEGNPAKVIYDKSIALLGSRYVGVQKEHMMLNTGEIVDSHIYELQKTDYLNSFFKSRGTL